MLWLALPYTLHACKDLPELVAALLRTWIWTWTPANSSAAAAQKLTLTPSYESDFVRAEFADVLRALGPVIEDVLGECDSHEGKESVDREDDRRGAEVEVEVCVVDKAEKREWWREEAHASFARLGARGRLAVTFEKCKSCLLQAPRWMLIRRWCAIGFWPEAQWLDDSDEGQLDEASLPAPQANEGGSAETHGANAGERAAIGSGVFEGRVPDGVARRRRGSSRFTRLRPPNLKVSVSSSLLHKVR